MLRLLAFIPLNLLIPLKTVGIHRIDLQHVDDNVEVHFPTGRVHLRCDSLHHLKCSFLNKSVAELRVPGLTRKKYRITCLVVDD